MTCIFFYNLQPNLVSHKNWTLSLFDQEKISEQLEGQRQEQALQRYHSEAEELDHWLLSTRATLSSALQPINEDMDMEEQLIDCQVRFAGDAGACFKT